MQVKVKSPGSCPLRHVSERAEIDPPGCYLCADGECDNDDEFPGFCPLLNRVIVILKDGD